MDLAALAKPLETGAAAARPAKVEAATIVENIFALSRSVVGGCD